MKFRQWSLRRRIMLVAVLPTFVAVLFLTAFQLLQRWHDVREEQQGIALLIMEDLAAASEYPLISGNYELIHPLIRTALKQPSVVAIEIRDTQGRELVRFLDEQYERVPAEDIQVLSYSVERELQLLDEFSEFEDSVAEDNEIQALATIHLSLADTFTREREITILWQSALAGLLVILISALIAHLTAFDIIRSLEKLSDYFARLARGDISARINVDDGAEVGCLQVDANQLATSLQQAEKDQNLFTERLMQEQEKVQQASRAKSEFLAMMSHEFRTPLNGAIGMLQLMEQSLTEAEFKDYKGMAEQSLSHLTQLLEDVLVVVDTEKNKLQVLFADHKIQDILSTQIDNFTSAAMNRGISLVVDYDKQLKKQAIRIDPSLIRQVVRHLVDNALKFTTEGMVIVEVRLLPEQEQYKLLIQVSDSGIGIPPEKKQQVLEAFQQVSSSFSRRYDGVGLGLTISHHICRILGGDLSLHDNPGGGTRVEATFPIELSHSPDEVTRQAAGTHQVLIVEDNLVNMKVAEKMLLKSFANMTVDAVESGEKCLDSIEGSDYDLILMDCQMPGLDGFETSRKLRDRGIDIPIVACTANTTDQIYQKCIDSGMNDYIAKPLKIDTIKKKLERWL